ncbi:DUF1496 domain-containing protein [Pseudoalteromonas pernae]|uniref:DUF1496 domain-containing protein n=1 Tax=Pseudoalteromonas pernae TaxID=3118054 RepID=UPI003242D3A6
MKKTLLVLALLSSAQLYASEPKRPNIIVGSGDALSSTQVCWYKEQRFSEGAIVAMGDTAKVCALKFPSQPNGPLIWLSVDDQGNAIYPLKKNKVSVR